MNAEKPYTGPTITHQAFEHLPHPWKKDEIMTRHWSKWTDGKVTHADSESTYHPTPQGTLIGSNYINLGRDLDLRTPPCLNWIDTTKILTAKVL